MTGYVAVASADEIPPGSGRTVHVQERAVALFNVDGEFYALDGVCLHRGGPVGDGDLDGTCVTCPWHGWQYDVTTGEHIFDRSVTLTKHDAKVVDGTVYVSLSD